MRTLELIQLFVEPLQNANIPYMITGSVAAIVYGEPRLTHDIDLVMHLNRISVEQLPALFPEHSYYLPPQDIIEIERNRERHGHFNILHPESGFKADCYIACDDLHRWALASRRLLPVSDELSVWVAPPEYVILRKLSYYREGGSEKHLRDIQKILQMTSIDQNLVATWVKSLTLEAEWKKLSAIER